MVIRLALVITLVIKFLGDIPYIGPLESGKVGGISLAIAIGLTIFKSILLCNLHITRLYGDIGGTKRLFSLSMAIGACILFPFAMFQLFTVSMK
jgi:hypothetical protein